MACLDVTPPRLLTGTIRYYLLPAYLQLQRLLRIIGSLIGQCCELSSFTAEPPMPINDERGGLIMRRNIIFSHLSHYINDN